MLKQLLKEKEMSLYQLSRLSDVPYSTLSDIARGKTPLNKCSAGTLYHIANALNVSMETLLDPLLKERMDFDLFKSNMCHRLKAQGDLKFLSEILENDEVRYYQRLQWYAECLYTLAMADYLSRINHVPQCREYDDLRGCKLSETVYPKSILALYILEDHDPKVLENAIKNSIPEFSRFNIAEAEVRNIA